MNQHLEQDKRQLFIGDPARGKTLEPQLLHFNGDSTLRTLFGINDETKDTLEWMTDHKTESALLIAESSSSITFPDYLMNAIEFIE